jgi:hypothetical protein
MAIPGSSYSHKNNIFEESNYYSSNSDPAEEFPALSDISTYFFPYSIEVLKSYPSFRHLRFLVCEKN